MDKLKVVIASVMMCMLGILSVNAQEYAGVYTGRLENVTMNDDNYDDVENVTFTLTHISGKNYNLTSSEIGPIGKMPGTITVDAKVTIEDGVLSAGEGERAGTLKLSFGGIPFPIYMSSITGNVTESPLTFTLDTYSLKFMGYDMFEASVTFVEE